MSAPGVRKDYAPCVAVVGMHRSGTSATAGLLVGLGLDGPQEDDLVPADSSNERGHWESESVHLCNSHVLAAWGATAYAPPPVETGWESAARFDDARREATQWFTSTSAGRPLVMKDPRLCLTLPLWRAAIPARLGAVLVLRDPMEVARSLQARDGIPVMLGLAMWDRYLRSAAVGLAGLPSLVVEYDAMLANPVKATESMSDFLEQLGVRAEAGMRDAAAGRLDPRLRHQDTDNATTTTTSCGRCATSSACWPSAGAATTPGSRPPFPRRRRGWTTCCSSGVSSPLPHASCTGSRRPGPIASSRGCGASPVAVRRRSGFRRRVPPAPRTGGRPDHGTWRRARAATPSWWACTAAARPPWRTWCRGSAWPCPTIPT